MRADVLLEMFLCLSLAAAARAIEPVELVTAQIIAPTDRPKHTGRLEYGAQFAIPLATANTSDTELGLQGGLTLTQMLNSVAGIGLDVAYHYWPTSSEFIADYNARLRSESFNLLELGGTSWAISALQFTGHLKIAAPSNGWAVPWLQLGIGGYIVNPHIRGLIVPDGSLVPTKPADSVFMPGGYGTVGVDFGRGVGPRVGLDATYDQVWSWSSTDLGVNFGAFAVGCHVLFGR